MTLSFVRSLTSQQGKLLSARPLDIMMGSRSLLIPRAGSSPPRKDRPLLFTCSSSTVFLFFNGSGNVTGTLPSLVWSFPPHPLPTEQGFFTSSFRAVKDALPLEVPQKFAQTFFPPFWVSSSKTISPPPGGRASYCRCGQDHFLRRQAPFFPFLPPCNLPTSRLSCPVPLPLSSVPDLK